MTKAAVSIFIAMCLARWPAFAASALSPIYAGARSELHASAVPVLLPVPIPADLGAIRSVSVIDAGRNGYYVGFSSVKGCSGALSCAYFHVAGSPLRMSDHAYRRDRHIRLPDGTRGYYRAQDCSGASCVEASLIFERAAALYELDAKLGSQDLTLLERAYQNLHLIR